MSAPVVKVKKLDPAAKLPAYQKAGDVCADVFSLEDRRIPPGAHRLIRTGIALELPEGYCARLRSRSGLAKDHALEVGAGTIDNGYRGELGVILHNLGAFGYEVKAGDRVAQVLIEKFEQAQFEEAETLTDSERGAGGFGSTGRA